MSLPTPARLTFALAYVLGVTACMAAPGRVAALPSAPFSGFVRPSRWQTLSGPSAQQQQGHGPIAGIPAPTARNAELWFWYLRPRHIAIKSLGGIGVSYVTLVQQTTGQAAVRLAPIGYTLARTPLFRNSMRAPNDNGRNA